MLKTTLFILSLLVASFSYNISDFAIQNNHEEYFSPDFYLRPEFDDELRNASEIDISGRTKIGSKQNQSNIGSINYQLSTSGLSVVKPSWPNIGSSRRRPTTNPSGGVNLNILRPTPILNGIRQILQRYMALLSRLFPNLFGWFFSTTTIVTWITKSTTSCAERRRRRAVIEDLIINQHAAEEQLEREMSSLITPVNESLVLAMKRLDKREGNPVNLLLNSNIDSDVKGSIYNRQDEEEIALLRKELKMSPLQAAQLAKKLQLTYKISSDDSLAKDDPVSITRQCFVPCLKPPQLGGSQCIENFFPPPMFFIQCPHNDCHQTIIT